MPAKVTATKALSLHQRGRLLFIFNRPNRRGYLPEVTGDALHAKGYVIPVQTYVENTPRRKIRRTVYGLTQAGLRYCQTGKVIGE